MAVQKNSLDDINIINKRSLHSNKKYLEGSRPTMEDIFTHKNKINGSKLKHHSFHYMK